ncbi:MAG: tripartite tricarboxylate transporter substrate binding protein [Comamonadaceae bacterium]|nr:tripartite tricarboxylate transporter substrate binding protein [Comamonadaceae bacterium]
MRLRFRTLNVAIGVFCVGFATTAIGAETDYPSRPIRLIVPYAPGGSTDQVARQYAELMRRELKQTVLIENRPGASTNIGNKMVADAEADGYTLLYATGQVVQSFVFGPFPAIDPKAALEPVSLILTSPQMIAAGKDQKISSPEELIAAAKANPKGVSVATAGLQLYVSVLQSGAGIELLHVPYKGGAPAVTDTIGGRTNLVMGQPPVLMPFFKKGLLKPVAMLSKEPFAGLPDVRTFAQAGVSNVNLVTWNAVFAPKGTPASVIKRLSQATQVALADPSLQKLSSEGLMVQASTPAQLAERVDSELELWRGQAKRSPELMQAR